MAGSSKDAGDDSQLFLNVFTEGPLEELTTRCDVITAASLVGSSKLFLDSAKDSDTLSASLPFGLPCVLHSHPTKRPRDHLDYLIDGSPRDCQLTPLDRFSSDAVIPDGIYDQRVGANGDWIATAGFKCSLELVNVYTRRTISLPAVNFQATNQPDIFIFPNGDSAVLKKIAICQVPTAAEKYEDFCLVAVFDTRIAVLHGHDSEWTVLLPHHSVRYWLYSDAIMHKGLVFATSLFGEVHALDPLHPGNYSFFI